MSLNLWPVLLYVSFKEKNRASVLYLDSRPEFIILKLFKQNEFQEIKFETK